MVTFTDYMNEYKKQMQKGIISQAYKGLMEYMMSLKTHLKNKYPDYYLSSNIYFGYMDMTYFSFIPKSLKQLKLKPAIVFIHETCRFEIWLAAVNKQIQSKYWKLFKESNWNKYHLVPSTESVDSVLEHVLEDNPDFSDLGSLTNKIEKGSLMFLKDIENFLRKL
jgi:hypothetical protein